MGDVTTTPLPTRAKAIAREPSQIQAPTAQNIQNVASTATQVSPSVQVPPGASGVSEALQLQALGAETQNLGVRFREAARRTQQQDEAISLRENTLEFTKDLSELRSQVDVGNQADVNGFGTQAKEKFDEYAKEAENGSMNYQRNQAILLEETMREHINSLSVDRSKHRRDKIKTLYTDQTNRIMQMPMAEVNFDDQVESFRILANDRREWGGVTLFELLGENEGMALLQEQDQALFLRHFDHHMKALEADPTNVDKNALILFSLRNPWVHGTLTSKQMSEVRDRYAKTRVKVSGTEAETEEEKAEGKLLGYASAREKIFKQMVDERGGYAEARKNDVMPTDNEVRARMGLKPLVEKEPPVVLGKDAILVSTTGNILVSNLSAVETPKKIAKNDHDYLRAYLDIPAGDPIPRAVLDEYKNLAAKGPLVVFPGQDALTGAIGGGIGKEVNRVFEQATKSVAVRHQINLLLAANKGGKFVTGLFPDFRIAVSRIVEFFGVDITSKFWKRFVGHAPTGDILDSGFVRFVGQYAKDLGRITNMSLKFAERVFPSLARTQAGNELIMRFMLELQDIIIKRASLVSKFISENTDPVTGRINAFPEGKTSLVDVMNNFDTKSLITEQLVKDMETAAEANKNIRWEDVVAGEAGAPEDVRNIAAPTGYESAGETRDGRPIFVNPDLDANDPRKYIVGDEILSPTPTPADSPAGEVTEVPPGSGVTFLEEVTEEGEEITELLEQGQFNADETAAIKSVLKEWGDSYEMSKKEFSTLFPKTSAGTARLISRKKLIEKAVKVLGPKFKKDLTPVLDVITAEINSRRGKKGKKGKK